MDVAIEVLRSATNCQQRIDDVNKTSATNIQRSKMCAGGFNTREKSYSSGTLQVRLNLYKD